MARSPLDSASWRAPASLSAMYRGADSASSSSESIESNRERVLLHVYELGAGTRLAELIRGLNAVTKSGLGAGGVFHAAIEVENLSRGLEWSYGYSADGSGVFAIKAKQHPDHTYRETVVLGRTALNREQLLKRLRQMQSDWAGDEYHLVRCNCISYCKALSAELGVQPLPEWVDRFPRIGAGGLDLAESVAARAVEYRDTIAASLPRAPSMDVWQIASEEGPGTTTPASDAMGEFLLFCNWCVMGAAGYAGVQVGRLQRAIAAETQALEEEGEGAGAAEAAEEAREAREAAAGFDEAEAEEEVVAAQAPSQ